ALPRMSSILRAVSSFLYRKPSRIVQELQSNARQVAWSREHPVPHVCAHRLELYEYVNREILKLAPIDYLEFGVFKGESIFNWMELNPDPASRFVGFDTFTGLPETWDRISSSRPSGDFDVGGQIPRTNDNRVQFVKGLFQDTLPGFLEHFEPTNPLVIHNDSD